jgi:hypothetical protein
MGMYAEDGDDDELSGFLTSSAPMSDEQKAALIDKVGLGSKIGDDASVKEAKEASDHRNKMTGLFEGLSTAFAGPQKTDSSYYSGLRGQEQARVKGAEDAYKDRQRVAQYIIGRDDKLRAMQAEKTAGTWTKDADPDADGYEVLRNAKGEAKRGARVVMKEPKGETGSWGNAGFDEHGNVVQVNNKTGAQRTLDGVKAKGGEGTKLVASEVAQGIGKYDAADTLLGDLQKNWDARASGRGSSLKQFIPGTDANLYSNSADLTAQNIGQILEGGKLTDSDYGRYKAMMPGAADTAEQAKNKFAEIARQIAEKKRGSIHGAKEAGYNVSGFSEPPVLPTGLEATAKRAGGDGTAVAAPAPKVGDTKVVGGVTYQRTADGWVPK